MTTFLYLHINSSSVLFLYTIIPKLFNRCPLETFYIYNGAGNLNTLEEICAIVDNYLYNCNLLLRLYGNINSEPLGKQFVGLLNICSHLIRILFQDFKWLSASRWAQLLA